MTPTERESWPYRARFAHWLVGRLSPWLALAPPPEDWEPEDTYTRDMDAAYDAGVEAGYEAAARDAEGGLLW